MSPLDLDKLYKFRFPQEDLEAKNAIWQVLCRDFFQRFIGRDDAVVDLGGGYCEFLGNIECGQKTAVDINPDSASCLPPGVTLVARPSWEMKEIGSGSTDVVFASNFFEHLPTKDRLIDTLTEIHRVLKPGGKLLILQPNLAYLGGSFFDFLDHHLPLTHVSMEEALGLAGFRVILCIPRFLPFTTRSHIPQHPLLVKLYLRFPPAWRIMGKQMFIHAEKIEGTPV